MGISKMLAISKTLDQSSFTSPRRTFSDFPGFLRKWKAVEENRKAVEEIGKPFQKAESR
jgi:hypothetical protein